MNSSILLVALPGLACAASIELLAPDQTCHLELSSSNRWGSFVIAVVGAADATCCPGFTGAEFSVDGLTGDWMAITLANAEANAVIGDPFTNGANISFPTASMAPSVQIYSVEIGWLASGEPPPTVLRVVAKDPPSNPLDACPLVTGGGNCPCWAMACVTGGSLYINGTGDCLVGVEPATWASVKQLFR